MKILKSLLIIGFISAMLVLTGCGQKQEETIDVGVALALSGFGAFFGDFELKSVQLATEEINSQGGINGKKINLIVEDTQSGLKETVSAVTKLADVDDVKFIIGPTFTEFGEVASPVAQEKGILLIAPSSSGESEAFRSRNFISLWPLERFEIKPLVQHIKDSEKDNVAVFYNQNAWSQMVNDFFVDEAGKLGIEVKSVAFNPDDNDFRTELAKAKDDGFDVLYLPLLEFVRGEAIKQARVQGFEFIYSTASTEDINLLNNYGEVMEGVIYPKPVDGPKQAEFIDAYKNKWRSSSIPFCSNSI